MQPWPHLLPDILEEAQGFFDGRSIENFFYVVHGDLFNVPVLKDPVTDQLSNAEIEKSNAVQLNGKWFDLVLIGKYLERGDYRDPSGKSFTKEELTPILERLQITYREYKSDKHIILELILFFTKEIEDTLAQMLTHTKENFVESLPSFNLLFDELFNHLKLCVSGLSLYNTLNAYTLCTAAFQKVSKLHAEANEAYNEVAIDIVYQGLGNLCTSVSSAILRSKGKDEMCKLISRTKKSSSLKFQTQDGLF